MIARPTRFGFTLLVALELFAGCASRNKPDPQPLEPLTPKIAASVAWQQKLDGVQFPLAIAVSPGMFTVAGNDGSVMALDAATGREVWRGSAGGKLSAGVGSDGRFAAVVTREGELVVLDQGQVKWRKAIGSRIATAPLVAGERVFVLGVDRSVQAFDALDGRKLWVLQRPGEALTLSQSGVLTAFKNTLIAGQGPRMAGIEPTQGTVKWDVTVGSPRGANELERLADLVGPAVRNGDVICVRSFQAAVGCVNAESGTLAWSKVAGGTDAVTGDAQLVFAGDASDRVTAWRADNGDVVWTSDKLLYRSLGSPAAFNKSVVFGDENGTLHWLARDTGEAQLRSTTDGSAITVQPSISGNTMLVVTRKGGLFAFRQ